MNKLYNTQSDFTTNFENFLLNAIPDIRKTQIKIIPPIILSMIISESCVPIDMAKTLKDDFSSIHIDSLIKRIRRFFSPYDFYQRIIEYVIKSFKVKHDDKTLYITFDHMFSKHNYTVFMFTLRIGTFGIPIWYKCFKDFSNNDAFKIDTIKEGIISVSNLFNNTDFNLVFLVDRWFGSHKILEIIESLGHTYSIRLKGNICVYKDNKKLKAKKLKHRKHKSVIHQNVYITENRFKSNIVYSSTCNTKDPWIIATNGNTYKAIKSYSYRFSSIETMFKAQKSNGFNLEKISNSSLKSFETMYTMVCTCILFLTILGTDFSKNTRCYRKIKIETHKTYNINGTKVKKELCHYLMLVLLYLNLLLIPLFTLEFPFP